jgi:hypothetical protein
MGATPQARPIRATDGPSVTTPGRQCRGAVVGAEARARRHQSQVPEYASTTSLELGLAGSMFHFWCPVPAQVRTDTQTHREDEEETEAENEEGDL